MYPGLSSYLSARLLDRAGGHRARVLDLFRQRRQADYYSRLRLDAVRGEALARLLNHARVCVPRIRAALGSRGEIAPAEALAVLQQLPVMRRADIQAQSASFIAEGATGLTDDFTGGSSGTPLCFKVDRATQQAREASLYWANSLAGWRYGERIAMLWGSDRDSAAARRNWRLEARWLVDNMRWYNAFNMGEDRMEEFHRAMTRFRPHLIVAYAGSIFTYARYLEQVNQSPNYPITSIVSSAEVITPAMREVVERVFKVPVFDRYGNREAGAIAAECEAHQGLHINEGDFVVEIDSRNPYSEPGPLLITYLANQAMPLIRYDTGDLATWSRKPCPCGRTTLRLARVVGRQSDNIRTASGKLIHGEYFTHLLYGIPQVREFQFIQETLQRYRLLLVADASLPAPVLERMKTTILNEVGAQCKVTVERVESIPVLSSGKRKFTLSLVDQPAR